MMQDLGGAGVGEENYISECELSADLVNAGDVAKEGQAWGVM